MDSVNTLCYGVLSCAYAGYIYNNDGYIQCEGDKACYFANIYLDNESKLSNSLLCYGDRSCAETVIQSEKSQIFRGHLSAQNAFLISGASDMEYIFQGMLTIYICQMHYINILLSNNTINFNK